MLRKRAEQAWRLRWGSTLSSTAASLLELPGARGADGATPPPHEVERDFRFAGLVLRVRLLVSVVPLSADFQSHECFSQQRLSQKKNMVVRRRSPKSTADARSRLRGFRVRVFSVF